MDEEGREKGRNWKRRGARLTKGKPVEDCHESKWNWMGVTGGGTLAGGKSVEERNKDGQGDDKAAGTRVKGTVPRKVL